MAYFFNTLGGEPLLGLPVVLAYPYYDPELGQLFPFRTLCMTIALVSHIVVSLLASWIFENNYLSIKWDVLHCFNALDESCVSPSLHQNSTIAEEKSEDKYSYRLSSDSSDATLSVEQFELTTVHRGQVNPSFSL